MPIKNRELGQGLVETLLAVTVAVIVVTSLISLGVFALRNSRQASYTSQATQIAQAQLEYARAYRDLSTTTWSTFYNLSLSSSSPTCFANCYFTDVSAPTTGTNTSTSPFTYYTKLSCAPSQTCDATSGVIRVSVTVSWSIGGRTQNIYNYSDFTNWRLK